MAKFRQYCDSRTRGQRDLEPAKREKPPRQQDVRIPVRLQTTPVHFGGFRWWFTCPLIVNDVPCRRRVAKLYSARSPCVGCRQCMGLTYESCWDTRTEARLWADIRRARQDG